MSSPTEAESPADATGDRQPARLVVLAGPTAVGKGSVADCVREHHPEVWISVSVTTRAPRAGEVDGVHYHFIDDACFDAMIARGELLEWARVHGAHRSGTPRGPVEQALASGRSALLELDLQGAHQVRARMPHALFVFLAPPSWDELVRRLLGRGTEDENQRRRRLRSAEHELAAAAEFDVTIVNRDVPAACQELIALIQSPADQPVVQPE